MMTRSKIFYGWWIVLACFLISFYVGSVVFFGLTAFVEPFINEFGWSYTQVSLASSLRGLEMGLFAPFVGFLVDRFGSRKLILFGTIIIGLALILLSRTQTLAMLYGAYILLALGAGGCTSVVLIVAVANWFDRKVGTALGVMASGTGASGLAVPVIVRLIDVYEWRMTLIILGLGMWALAIPIAFVIRNSPEAYGFFPDGDIPKPPLSFKAEDKEKANSPDFKAILKNETFVCLSLIEAFRMMAVSAVVFHVMPYLGSVGLSRTTAGFVAAGIPLCSIIGRFGFGWLGDVFQKRYVMAITFCLMATGMLAFSSIHIYWVILPFLLLFAPGFGGSMVLRGALLREYFGRKSLGKMLGIIMGSAAMGGVIGPTLAGYIFDTTGSYRPVWFIYCGTLMVAFFLIFRFKPFKG